MATFLYSSGDAAGNLYMTQNNIECTLCLDWSFDAIYFRNPETNIWYTLGTGPQTTKCDWDNMTQQEQSTCIIMLHYAKHNHKDHYTRVNANSILNKDSLVLSGDDTD